MPPQKIRLRNLTLMTEIYEGLGYEENKGLAQELSDELTTQIKGGKGFISLRGLKSLELVVSDIYDVKESPDTFEDWNRVEEQGDEELGEEGKNQERERRVPVIMTREQVFEQIKAEIKSVGENIAAIVTQPAST